MIKQWGGHVAAKDTYDLTTIKECAEELGFPASILPEEDFERAIKVTNLSIVGIFRQVDYLSNQLSTRVTKKGDKFIQPYMTATYIGYYDGAIRFIDGESSGIETFSPEELTEEIKDNSNKFTEDLKFMIKKYEKFLKPI
tara:strand:- start:459 stop:878 length:420 start_codon:yes stop_codon:yes gene_type:complete